MALLDSAVVAAESSCAGALPSIVGSSIRGRRNTGVTRTNDSGPAGQGTGDRGLLAAAATTHRLMLLMSQRSGR